MTDRDNLPATAATSVPSAFVRVREDSATTTDKFEFDIMKIEATRILTPNTTTVKMGTVQVTFVEMASTGTPLMLVRAPTKLVMTRVTDDDAGPVELTFGGSEVRMTGAICSLQRGLDDYYFTYVTSDHVMSEFKTEHPGWLCYDGTLISALHGCERYVTTSVLGDFEREFHTQGELDLSNLAVGHVVDKVLHLACCLAARIVRPNPLAIPDILATALPSQSLYARCLDRMVTIGLLRRDDDPGVAPTVTDYRRKAWMILIGRWESLDWRTAIGHFVGHHTVGFAWEHVSFLGQHQPQLVAPALEEEE